MSVLDWSKLPDLAAVALLSSAFASVSRRSQINTSGLWLTGWVLIALHFGALMFVHTPGISGVLGAVVGLSSLAGAGVLFMRASVPYRHERSSQWMFAVLLGTNMLYAGVISVGPAAAWALTPAAILLGSLPFLLALLSLSRFNHGLRWFIVVLQASLSIFLLIVQHRPDDGEDLALCAVLFSVYFGCAIHFWYAYRRPTTGAFITICGFFAWALVFVVGPMTQVFLPRVVIENEVWNLPKYVVAVGMILLLLENQIEHNKYLALHDELTGLPNRRLFQDRLMSALERARRTETQTALLVVDLNRFKQVNDSFGHHIGDLLLQRVASIFAGRVRHSDTVARTGGDEFSIILEEPTSRASANYVAHSLLQLLKDPLQLEEHTVSVGASIGIAVFPEDATAMEALCIAADLRMYHDKHGSREGSRQQPFSLSGGAPSHSAAHGTFDPGPQAGLQFRPEENGS